MALSADKSLDITMCLVSSRINFLFVNNCLYTSMLSLFKKNSNRKNLLSAGKEASPVFSSVYVAVFRT